MSFFEMLLFVFLTILIVGGITGFSFVIGTWLLSMAEHDDDDKY